MLKNISEIVDSYAQKYDWFTPNDFTELDIAVNLAAEYDNLDLQDEIMKFVANMPKWLKINTATSAIRYAMMRDYDREKDFIIRLQKVALACLE